MAATKGDQARVRGGDFEELVWCRGRAVQPAEELGRDQNIFLQKLFTLVKKAPFPGTKVNTESFKVRPLIAMWPPGVCTVDDPGKQSLIHFTVLAGQG